MTPEPTPPEPDPATPNSVGVRVIVRDIVSEVAPEELPLMDGLDRFDDAAALRRLTRRPNREPLAFGLAEMAALVTPVLWLVLDQTAQKVAGAAVDGTVRGLRGLLRKLRPRADSRVVIPALTPDQLAAVRNEFLRTADEHGLRRERAKAIGNALVTRLALIGTSDPPSQLDEES